MAVIVYILINILFPFVYERDAQLFLINVTYWLQNSLLISHISLLSFVFDPRVWLKMLLTLNKIMKLSQRSCVIVINIET